MTTNNSNSKFFIIFVNVVLGAVLVTAMNKAINPLQDKALIQFLTSKWECKKNVSLVGSIKSYFKNPHKPFQRPFFPDTIDVIVHGGKIETGLDSFLNSFNKKMNSHGCSFQSDLKPLVDELISLYWHNLSLAAIFIIFVIKYAHEGVRIQDIFNSPRCFYSSLLIYASQISALLFFIIFAKHLHEKPHYWLEFFVITASFLIQDSILWRVYGNNDHQSSIWILQVWLFLDILSLVGVLLVAVYPLDVHEIGMNNICICLSIIFLAMPLLLAAFLFILWGFYKTTNKIYIIIISIIFVATLLSILWGFYQTGDNICLSIMFLAMHSFVPYLVDIGIALFDKSRKTFHFDHNRNGPHGNIH